MIIASVNFMFNKPIIDIEVICAVKVFDDLIFV